ncbi:hypothetical protein D9756_009183 [Leucocoprinus leucothites]|uniref:Uncharacterized protein n=1 Tax=Leucocoprinus leucothites TaxID=201217 RepID=A0A8H5CXW7_9AGAR|nr:hypothetical protein D9756_009183 [Leucoagaricus leucothites]
MNQVRHLPRAELKEHYNVGDKAWMERKVLLPLQDDQEKREAFCAFCDEICGMQPVAPGDHIRITFACAAACQVITDRDIFDMDEEESEDTFALAWKYMYVITIFQSFAQANQILHSSSKRERYYPPPSMTNGTSGESLPGIRLADGPSYDLPSPLRQDMAETLPGQTVRYRDARTREITECEVLDHGWSDLRGEWFMISHGSDGSGEMISVREMKDIVKLSAS